MSQPKGNECAFGHAAENGHCPGITKREWLAGMALIGISAMAERVIPDKEGMAEECYARADALLAHQERP